jgi:hypothetical protein
MTTVAELQDFVNNTSDPQQIANKIKELGGLSPDLINVMVQKFGSNPTSVQTAYNELTTPGSLNRNAEFLTRPNPRGFVIGDPAEFNVAPIVALIAAAYGIPAISDAISSGGLFSSLPSATSTLLPESSFLSGMAAENAVSGAGGLLSSGAGALEAGAVAGAGADAAFVAADAAQLAAQGLSQAAIEQNLIGAGVDSFLAADAAQLAAQGIGENQMTQLLTQSADGTPIFPATSPTNIPNPSTPPSSGNTPPVAPPVSGVPPTGTIPPIVPPISPADALTKVATTVGTGLLSSAATAGVKDLLNPNVIQGGLQTAGGLLQSQASKDAALKAQQDILAATQKATTGAQFRPVGITTNFGSSQFQIDPATGQLVSAGYTANPAITSAENQLMQLGSSYLAQTPEQVAQQYLSKQYELLDPSRQRQLAAIRNQNFQTGRGGLSVGSTGLRPSGAQGLMGTNPELEAYYNALAQQDAQLAASAQQAGQQQVTYGAGLFGRAGNLESLAQQPFTLGTGLGTSISTAGARAGELGLKGAGTGAIISTGADATRNPYATLLGAVGGPTSTLGAGLNKYLTDYLATNKASDIFDTSKYGTGLEGFQKALDDIYG